MPAHRTQHTAYKNKDEGPIIPTSLRPLLSAIGRMTHQLDMSAYAVGGCVRDWLLGIDDAVDVDVTIEGDGLVVARLAAVVFDAELIVHQQFGTATLTLSPSSAASSTQRMRIDMATCRKERYARPAAYPTVSVGTLTDDLFRRDFTVNAVAVALAPEAFGTIRDPFHGVPDLRQRWLRMLHPQSFVDDPSRILRGIRFRERFGLRWERATERALHEALANGALGRLNAGRLHKELSRMTEEPHPQRCFRALATLLRASS